MRHVRIHGSIALLTALLTTACASAPPGAPPADSVSVVPADARALRYGSSAPAVFDNPEMREKVRALFGSDWTPTAQGGGRLEYGAPEYFPANAAMRMLRIGGADYIAIMGCVPSACDNHRGLILISADGDKLWARLDEGGFSRYYGHGPAMSSAAVSPGFIDSAWRAVERVDRA